LQEKNIENSEMVLAAPAGASVVGSSKMQCECRFVKNPDLFNMLQESPKEEINAFVQTKERKLHKIPNEGSLPIPETGMIQKKMPSKINFVQEEADYGVVNSKEEVLLNEVEQLKNQLELMEQKLGAQEQVNNLYQRPGTEELLQNNLMGGTNQLGGGGANIEELLMAQMAEKERELELEKIINNNLLAKRYAGDNDIFLQKTGGNEQELLEFMDAYNKYKDYQNLIQAQTKKKLNQETL